MIWQQIVLLARLPGGYQCTRVWLPSGYVKIAIENGHLWWIFPLKMVIFHSYVSLPVPEVNTWKSMKNT
jgi:hypothetical protein